MDNKITLSLSFNDEGGSIEIEAEPGATNISVFAISTALDILFKRISAAASIVVTEKLGKDEAKSMTDEQITLHIKNVSIGEVNQILRKNRS